MCRNMLVGFILLFFTGCASTPAVRFIWPPPPEQPRLEWKGVYYSEDSFKLSSGAQAFNKFLGSQESIVMKTPFGIASDGKGIVYVSDMHAHNVHVFDFNTKKVELLSKLPSFDSPAGLDVDSRGRLYVADPGRGQVFVFDKDHHALFAFGKEIFKRPAYVEVDEVRQRIYVADGLQNLIAVFDLEGKHLFSFGKLGEKEGELHAPQGLAMSKDGKLFVVDMFNARIQVFDPDGKFLYMFGERGDQAFQFENPKDLAFDSEGNLYVIDARRARMTIYTPEGKVLLVIGGSATTHPMGFSAPKSIFIDGNDRIYIAESLNKRFSTWQYMSATYLQHNPYTDADRKILEDYVKQQAAKKQ